jgi:polyhydroxyalkanoate synthesis repressor PhaR
VPSSAFVSTCAAGPAAARHERAPPPMPKPRIIKKYPNRRLYDTEISSYITLEDVRQLIVDGEEVEVRDAKSGEDLSRSVLLQIIAEHEEKGSPMFSTQLLSQVIRFYGDSLQGFMGSYLERSMQLFLDQQHQFRSQLNSLLGKTPWSMLNQLTERNLDMWRNFQEGMIRGETGRRAEGGKPAEPEPPSEPSKPGSRGRR